MTCREASTSWKRTTAAIATDRRAARKAPTNLLPDEKKVYDAVAGAGGTIFQSELNEKAGMSKVKVTRILDKLEGKGLISRIRRGMTNVVIIKD